MGTSSNVLKMLILEYGKVFCCLRSYESSNCLFSEGESECSGSNDASDTVFVIWKRTKHADSYQSFHTLLEFQQVKFLCC